MSSAGPHLFGVVLAACGTIFSTGPCVYVYAILSQLLRETGRLEYYANDGADISTLALSVRTTVSQRTVHVNVWRHTVLPWNRRRIPFCRIYDRKFNWIYVVSHFAAINYFPKAKVKADSKQHNCFAKDEQTRRKKFYLRSKSRHKTRTRLSKIHRRKFAENLTGILEF